MVGFVSMCQAYPGQGYALFTHRPIHCTPKK